MTPKWSQNGTTMVPKWPENGTKMVPKWSQNGPTMVRKVPKMVPKHKKKVQIFRFFPLFGPRGDPTLTPRGTAPLPQSLPPPKKKVIMKNDGEGEGGVRQDSMRLGSDLGVNAGCRSVRCRPIFFSLAVDYEPKMRRTLYSPSWGKRLAQHVPMLQEMQGMAINVNELKQGLVTSMRHERVPKWSVGPQKSVQKEGGRVRKGPETRKACLLVSKNTQNIVNVIPGTHSLHTDPFL